MRYAGMGWPTGAVDNARIFALPSPRLLMLSSEARWHLDEAIGAEKQVLWRGVPEPGQRPAEVGYSPYRYAHAALNHLVEQRHDPAGFIGWNELDLNGERGDGNDDWANLDDRYRLLGAFLGQVVQTLRTSLPQGVDLHFGAWTPDHYALDYVRYWRDAAESCDCVDLHAYGSTQQILDAIAAYRYAFPSARLCLTEWHASGDLESERETLQALADLADRDPLFEAAYFFIWRWDGAPGWWSTGFDVEHNTAREALFLSPPVASQPSPEPTPVPEPAPAPVPIPAPPEDPMPTPDELPRGVDVANYQGQPDWAAAKAAGLAFAVTKATEGTWYTNETFAYNWQALKEQGLARGAYHFARPDRGTAPEAEAAYFVQAVRARGLEPGDFLALDLEVGSGDLSQWTLSFLQAVEQAVGFKPLLYTAQGFIDGLNLANRPELGQYGLWLASWRATLPPAPAPWDVIAFWQHSDSGRVDGIAGTVDLDAFNGPVEHIRLYGMPGTEPAPAPSPSPEPPADETRVLREQISGLVVALADMNDREGDKIRSVVAELDGQRLTAERRHALMGKVRAALDEMDATRKQFVGPRS